MKLGKLFTESFQMMQTAYDMKFSMGQGVTNGLKSSKKASHQSEINELMWLNCRVSLRNSWREIGMGGIAHDRE